MPRLIKWKAAVILFYGSEKYDIAYMLELQVFCNNKHYTSLMNHTLHDTYHLLYI